MKKKSGFAKYSAAIAICSGIVLSLSILTFSDRATTPNRNNPFFNYGTGDYRNAIIQVVDDNRVEVPVFFDIDQNITEVRLEFSGDHSLMPGLAMSESTVSVKSGKAASTVILQFSENPGLKAGTHFLKIIARDSTTGRRKKDKNLFFISITSYRI